MLEVEVDGDIEVIVNTNVEVTAGNMNVAIIEDTNDIEVTVNRQEYVITGDEIYIPKRYEDAPTWMQNLITQVVDVSISAQIQDLNGISQSLESMIDAMEVAKNTYELSVISSNDIDERINTAVTTLNSSMNDADATILEVAQTRVTPEEASAITVDVITAELAKTEAGTLGATVSNLQTAVATEEEARSTSIEILTSSIEGAFDANATAMNYINTYVGLDEVGASTGTGLSGYLEGSTGIIGGADSKVVNNVYVDALGNAKSKFEYGSTVSVNGVTSTAGFGLSNSTGTGIGSEFWINAAKFKFTNNNKTGSKAPFTIDATGTVPEITFNGKVSFNNVTDYTPPDISGTINNNNDVFAQRLGYLSYADMVTAATNGKTIINGGYLRGELIEANSITAGQIDAYAIAGKQITGGTINGTEINGTKINGAVINGAVINGSVIKASYLDLDGAIQVLTNYHLCITQAKLNAVIAAGGTGQLYTNSTLMPDAIPINIPDPVTGIDVIDEYRIPSLSVLNWNGGSASAGANGPFGSGTFSASLNTGLHAYNVSNAGVNTKAVKIRPIMSIHGITMKTGVYKIDDLSAPYSTAHCIMYFGNIQLCKLRLWTYPQESGGRIRFTIERYGQSSLNGLNDELDGTTFTILGVSFSVSSEDYYPPGMTGYTTGRYVETTITVTKAIGELGFNFLSGSIRFEVYAEKPAFSDCRALVSSTGIQINNMI